MRSPLYPPLKLLPAPLGAAYLGVLGLTLLTLFGGLSAFVSELSYTALVGVTAWRLLRLARRSRGLRWARGIGAMAAAAATTALANVAWVYGSLVGGMPPVVELLGASLYMVQAAPWAFALSHALFIVYDRLWGTLYLELLTQLVGLAAAVTFLSALLLGLLLDTPLGIQIADTTATLYSSVLLLPALALLYSPQEARLNRPFRLISSATVAWALAANLYVYLPEAHADMVYNAFALAQWALFYSAAHVYVQLQGVQP
ncbi:hypothetical protein Trad_2341 [Truepera radiovictrix DSM 17093]|uniref:Uncharacterized protein n=2 Tax=Truepera TaxID=332248 RepID=D7CSN0_TRURR|nr:hypothetical protein Trad_2341 [Truepera radiovictrix DSM 17093]